MQKAQEEEMLALFNAVPKKQDEQQQEEEMNPDTGPTFTDITQEIEYQRANVVAKTKITEDVFQCASAALTVYIQVAWGAGRDAAVCNICISVYSGSYSCTAVRGNRDTLSHSLAPPECSWYHVLCYELLYPTLCLLACCLVAVSYALHTAAELACVCTAPHTQ